MASALLSSSPRSGDLFGSQVLHSSPLKSQSQHSDELELQDGEISPSFDASFASNLSFNNSENADHNPNGMDFSPAAPPPPKPKVQAPTNHTRGRALDRAKTYDSSFFSQLASQKRPSVQSNQSSGKPLTSSAASSDKGRVFGSILDTNSVRQTASSSKQHVSRPPLTKKTQSEAVLQLHPAPSGKSAAAVPTRPSLQRARGHTTSASTSMLDFARQNPPRPTTAPLLGSLSTESKRHGRSNSDASSSHSWWFFHSGSQTAAPPNQRSTSDPQTSTTGMTFAIPEESPSLDQMDIDSPPLPPDNHTNAMELDDMSFEALGPKQAADGSIAPPALMSALKDGQRSDFRDLFADSPAHLAGRSRANDSLPKQRSQGSMVPSGKKRSYEPDQSFDMSSEDASPSSPLAQIQVPTRPSLVKAASVATTVFPGFGPSRRRGSDRSSGRGSISSARALSSGQSSRRASFESSPPRDDRIQLQKKARADMAESSSAGSRPTQPRRADSAESRDDRRRQASATLNKAAQATMGLGLPPPARSSIQSEFLASRPRHVTSASESHMSFAMPKRRVASDSAAKVMPPETRMESDGKRLPCHQVAEDGLMRIKPETVSDLLEGKYDQIIERFVIVDCRFSFEYEGGHIDGAVNIQDENQLLDYFLTPGSGFLDGGRKLPQPCISDDPGLKPIIIFHCEFSQKRAPAIAGNLRKLDRARVHDYPNVHYPEIYILAGGYAELFKNHSHLCEPRAYVPMLKSSQGESAYDKFACRAKPGFAFARAKSFSAFENQMMSKRSEPKPPSNFGKEARSAANLAAPPSTSIQEDDHENSMDSSTSSSPGNTDASPCPGQGRAIKKPLGHVRIPSRPLYRSATTTNLPQNTNLQRQLFSVQ